MGRILAVPFGLITYVISLIAVLAFLFWFIDKPQEWDYFIPITTSLVASGVGMATAESSGGKDAAKTVAVLVAMFWIGFVIVDVVSDVSDIMQLLTGSSFFDLDKNMEHLMLIIDHIWSSKICAVVSLALASGN